MQAQYPDQPLLHQIDTQRRVRTEVAETESLKSRRAKGWEPQTEATGVFPIDPPGPGDYPTAS